MPSSKVSERLDASREYIHHWTMAWDFAESKSNRKLLENAKKTNNCTKPNLVEKIKLVWCTGISEDYLDKLVSSMLQRLRNVLAAKVGPTKY